MAFGNYVKLLLLLLVLAGSSSSSSALGREVDLMIPEDETTEVDEIPEYFDDLLRSMVEELGLGGPPRAREGQLCETRLGYNCESGLQCRLVTETNLQTFVCTKGNSPPPSPPPPASRGQLCSRDFPCLRGLICSITGSRLPTCRLPLDVSDKHH